MKLTFLGAAQTVTGSCYLLETEKSKILVDCGMFQGPNKLETLNRLAFPFNLEEIDFVLITHAHIDHIGRLPKLNKPNFRAKIFATHATRDLCEIMLPDSAHIHQEELRWQNRKRERAGLKPIDPIYTIEDAHAIVEAFETVDYDKQIKLTPDITVRFIDAGHILGSASIEVWVKERGKTRKITFSGDLGNGGQAIVRDPSIVEESDFILIETTYGNRVHKSREETVEEFKQILQNCDSRRGNTLIPAFAVERTQEMLFELGKLQRAGQLCDLPVYVDSPLAVSATEIFLKHPECYDEETWEMLQNGDSPLEIPNLVLSRSVESSRAINDVRRAIIIAASGMCHAGRIRHHLKHNLWKEDAHILFVGYQAEGTLGRQLLDGEKKVKLFGEDIAVRAQIHTLGGFSGHADQDGLLFWLSQLRKGKPRKTFLVHGEPNSMAFFAETIAQKLDLESHQPGWLESVEL